MSSYSPRLSRKAEAEMERKFAMQDRAMELLAIIAAEFESDPMSVQCFDLRLVSEVKEIAKVWPTLRDLF